MYVRYLVKIKKRHISYFDNALLEQYLLHQAWCETWSSSSTEETNWQSWHKFKMSTFGLNTSSQVCWPLVNCTIYQAAPHSYGMCVVCHFLWEGRSRKPVSCTFLDNFYSSSFSAFIKKIPNQSPSTVAFWFPSVSNQNCVFFSISLKYLPVIYITLHDNDVMFTSCIKKVNS